MTDTPHLTESIFIATVALANADERAAYIEEACGGDAALRGRVEALLRAHERAGHLLDRPVPGGPERTGACISNAQPGTVIAGRYKLLEAIGEGGMGAVWVAEQTQPVRRKVALKLIKPGMDSKSVLARFDAERQALAVMDHPNIAKVLDGGLTEWGRPFFVMEYVKGVPITEYCDSARLSVPERLNLFVQVCQAVQHAHQKGIIHRDLKPSNILVAPYDDKPVPKVIDFGLAKAMHQSLTERTLHTKHETVLGTPLYMSPEQAQLNNLDVDTRSDIYSLGVLLYELLTGTTPLEKQRFKEAAWEEIKRLVREEEPPRPSTRLSSSNTLASLAAGRQIEPARLTKLVRGELDWIVMKALEKDRTLRYDTANGFAMDIQRYLGGEAVLAAPPSAAYRLRKFARRNKGSLAVAGLVLFFLVLLGSGVGWAMRDRSAREAEAVRQQRERQAKLAGKVESIFGEVDRLKKEQKWPEALEAARRAEAAVAGGEADPATAEQVSQRLKELEFIDRLERIRMEKATLVEGTFNHSGADREYGRAFREYGVDVDELPVETSIDRLKASPALAVVLAAALDDWVYSRRQVSEVDVARWKRLVAVARGIDPEPLRDRVRATWGRPIADVRDDVGRLADSIDVRAQHPATLVILALGLQKAQHPDAALRILREAQHLHPGDFWLNFELGNVLNLRDDREGSTRYWTAAVAIRPSSAGAHNNLGVGLATQKKQDEAIACYRKAIELDPKEANAYSNLGTALVAQKKLPDAIAAYNKAIELDPKLTYAYFGLGNGLSAQKKLPEAIAAYNKAIELDPRLTCAYLGLGNGLSAQKKLPEAIAAYNKAIELDPKDAKAHSSLGIALHDQGKLEEAVTEHCKAIELNPKLARAHSDLGDALRGQGKLDGAVAECRKAIELDPKNAPAHNSLGIALHDQKKPDEAIAEFRKAVELDPEDAKAHTNLGNALRGQKKPDEAVAEHRKAIELDAKDPKAHFNLGNALRAHKKPDEAVAEYLKAIALGLKDANAYGGLGNALHDQKKLPEAIAAFHKAIELDPKDAGAHVNLGTALKDQGKRDEAVAECRMAIALDPKLAMPHYNLANGLRDQGKLEEAVAEYRKAIELDPKYAPAHNSLAAALCEQKKPDEAVAEFCRAIELDPKYAMAHNNLGLALADQGKLPEAIDAYNKAIELDPKYVNAHNNLGIALREQKKLPEAIDAYKRAIELDPKEAGAFRNLGAVLCDELNDFDGAIMCFRKVIELDPKDAAAHRNLGNALSAQKKWDEAFAAYRKAIDLDPKDARAHSTIGIALRQKGRIDEAIAECQTAVELNPKDIFARKSLGNALLAKGRLDEAIAEWKKVIELDSESASAHYALGIALKAKGDSDGAERAYREAVRLDGEHHGAAIDALADLLLSRGNWKEAVATYQKIMILDPKNTWAHYHLGIALKAKGDLDDAIAAFEEVIRRQPDFTSAHFALASALAEAKQWDRSASVYAAALKRFGAPLWPGPWYEAIRSDEVFTRLTAQQPDGRLPWIMRARLHALDRDWKRAATDYAHLYGSLANIDPAKHFPEGGDDLFGYGCLLLLQGDRPGYEQFCKQWAERVGDSAAWGFNLARAWGISSRPVVSAHLIVERAGKALQASRTAWNLHALSLAHYRNGEFERAIKRAEESNGGNWSGSAKALNWLVLAMAHSRLGQAADAHKSLQQALDLAGRASPEQPPGVEWPDMAPPDFVEFELLRREAEELINPKAKEERDK